MHMLQTLHFASSSFLLFHFVSFLLIFVSILFHFFVFPISFPISLACTGEKRAGRALLAGS
jgi:hypothetical protein